MYQDMTDVSFLHRDVTNLRSIPEMAFHGLQLLCSPKHGDQKEVRAGLGHMNGGSQGE